MNKKYFFQHPYELENDTRMKLLDKRMPDSGPGVFWKIFYRLRLGNGTYPLSAIISEIAGENKVRRRRVERVLNEFNLFIIENQMVTLANGLTISDIHPRNERKPSTRERLEKIQQNMSEGYENTLMPDELRQMDQAALQKVQADIRSQNEEQLDKVLNGSSCSNGSNGGFAQNGSSCSNSSNGGFAQNGSSCSNGSNGANRTIQNNSELILDPSN